MNDQRKHSRHVMSVVLGASDTTNDIYMVYGNGDTSIHTVRTWFRKFRAGNFILEDEDRLGRPFNTDTDSIVAMVKENPRYTVRQLADALKSEQPSIII